MGEPRLGTEGGSKSVQGGGVRFSQQIKMMCFLGSGPHKNERDRNTEEGEKPQHRGRPPRIQRRVHLVGKQLRRKGGLVGDGLRVPIYRFCVLEKWHQRYYGQVISAVRLRIYPKKSLPSDNSITRQSRRGGEQIRIDDIIKLGQLSESKSAPRM